MEPRAFLELAERLLKDSKCEASLRTCVSRSYYAFFNMVIQFLRPNFPKDFPRSAEAHKKVFEYLSDCGIEDVEIVASALDDLRDERNDADYQLNLTKFVDKHADAMHRKACHAMQSFEHAIASATGQEALINGIKSHKSRTNS
jgi:uncharacterized protein (UPF0332 family)